MITKDITTCCNIYVDKYQYVVVDTNLSFSIQRMARWLQKPSNYNVMHPSQDNICDIFLLWLLNENRREEKTRVRADKEAGRQNSGIRL